MIKGYGIVLEDWFELYNLNTYCNVGQPTTVQMKDVRVINIVNFIELLQMNFPIKTLLDHNDTKEVYIAGSYTAKDGPTLISPQGFDDTSFLKLLKDFAFKDKSGTCWKGAVQWDSKLIR